MGRRDPFEAESWWAVLDNADHFNFGSDWWRYMEFFPEVAGPLSPETEDKWIPRFRDPEYFDSIRHDFKPNLPKRKNEIPRNEK